MTVRRHFFNRDGQQLHRTAVTGEQTAFAVLLAPHGNQVDLQRPNIASDGPFHPLDACNS